MIEMVIKEITKKLNNNLTLNFLEDFSKRHKIYFKKGEAFWIIGNIEIQNSKVDVWKYLDIGRC